MCEKMYLLYQKSGCSSLQAAGRRGKEQEERMSISLSPLSLLSYSAVSLLPVLPLLLLVLIFLLFTAPADLMMLFLSLSSREDETRTDSGACPPDDHREVR